MALTQKLLIRQSQALVMTPQLMQAIKLLQLSHLDLAAYVDGEVERNPLLERPADQDQVRDDSETAAETPSAPEEEPSADWMDDRLESRQSIEARLDTDLNNIFPDDSAAGPARTPESQPGAYSDWTAAGGGGRRCRLARQTDTRIVNGLQLVGQAEASQADAIGSEGIGLQDFGARGDVIAMDAADQVGRGNA